MTCSNIVFNASFYQNRWKQRWRTGSRCILSATNFLCDVQCRLFFFFFYRRNPLSRRNSRPIRVIIRHINCCPIFRSVFRKHPCSRNIRSLFTTALDLFVAIQNSGIGTVFRKYPTNHFPQMFWTRALPFRFLYAARMREFCKFFFLFSFFLPPILDFKIRTIRRRVTREIEILLFQKILTFRIITQKRNLYPAMEI